MIEKESFLIGKENINVIFSYLYVGTDSCYIEIVNSKCFMFFLYSVGFRIL